MDLGMLREKIADAISLSVGSIKCFGIDDAETKNVAISSRHLHQIAAQLERENQMSVAISAEIELFLRLCNSELVASVQFISFRVELWSDDDGIRAAAVNEQEWTATWEKGIAPIKQAVLQSMKRDVWNIDPTLAEDSSTFQIAMILFASEVVGPWSEGIATFLGYPRAIVEVVAARLYEGRIWENGEVRYEKWSDPNIGGTCLFMDLMVAEGSLIRRWSEKDQQFRYFNPLLG
jgi:hypothetical protein